MQPKTMPRPSNSAPEREWTPCPWLQLLAFSPKTRLGSFIYKTQFAAISASHARVQGRTVFSHPLSKLVLKGLYSLFPLCVPIVPQWSLSLVLAQLMLPLFEPPGSFKVGFLVAITSAYRVGQLSALRAEYPFLRFLPSKVLL